MNTISSSVGIMMQRDDGTYLFQLRDNKKTIPHPNKWSLFGGGIEPGETPLDATIREIQEELGITLQKKRIHLIAQYTSHHKKRYVYYYALNKNEENNLNLNEGQQYAFFHLTRLILTRNVVPSLRFFLILHPYFKFWMRKRK